MTCLLRYDWPGNVRHLENTIERAVVLCRQEAIEPRHLPVNVKQGGPESTVQVRGMMPPEQALAAVERQLYTQAANRCSSTYEVARRWGSASRRRTSSCGSLGC